MEDTGLDDTCLRICILCWLGVTRLIACLRRMHAYFADLVFLQVDSMPEKDAGNLMEGYRWTYTRSDGQNLHYQLNIEIMTIHRLTGIWHRVQSDGWIMEHAIGLHWFSQNSSVLTHLFTAYGQFLLLFLIFLSCFIPPLQFSQTHPLQSPLLPWFCLLQDKLKTGETKQKHNFLLNHCQSRK